MDGRKKRGGEIPRAAAIWILSALILASIAPVSSMDDKCAACKLQRRRAEKITIPSNAGKWVNQNRCCWDLTSVLNDLQAELEIGLSNEKPRNHLDMRHRLDSRGQREGKVIDYKVSELRVVELLDGLCEKMQDYTLMKLESGKNEWVKVRDWDALKADKQEARAHSKKLSSFCGRLLEETEDELAELIKQGSAEPGGVNKALCQDLSKHCSSSRGSSNMDDREL